MKRSGRRRCLVLAMSMVVALSSNCSVSRGRTQLVHVTSTPPDSQVSLNGEPVGATPVYVEVRRRDADPVLRIGKAGFESVESELDRRLSRSFLRGDLVVALLLGGYVWTVSSLDYGPSSPRPIGYGALLATAALAPPLVLGSAFEFPEAVEVVLEPDGGGDPVGATVGGSVPPRFEVRSDLLRVYEGLANRAEGGEGTRLQERLRALRLGADGERRGRFLEAAPEGHR